MTQERFASVRIPADRAEEVRRLQVSAAAALQRHQEAPIGDMREALRFEQIQSAINDIAYAELVHLIRGTPSPDPSGLTIEVAWPFAPGRTDFPAVATAETRSVATIFRPKNMSVSPRDAVDERFSRQLANHVEWTGGKEDAPNPVNPSDVQNRVLSEALQRYCAGTPNSGTIMAGVVYRDGSAARPLPLRSLPMQDEFPNDGRLVLKLALMSVRHMDMDADVDGAWLRNREVSLPRPAGLTDELVYKQSRDQLARLAAREPIGLHLYQTGLAAANVGFYRALLDHHREGSGYSVAVLPWYYDGPDQDTGKGKYVDGTPWVLAE